MSFVKSYPDDIQKIVDAGFQVVEKSPWHHHVYHDGTLTNVWYTTKKYMRNGWKGSKQYSDVQEVIQSFRKPTGKPVYADQVPPIKDLPKEITDFHDKLRGKFK